ncbi:Peptidase inhibitor 16, partial [Cichlidogyrus casuarinus]
MDSRRLPKSGQASVISIASHLLIEFLLDNVATQNIATITTSTGRYDITRALDMWWDQNKDYSYDNNSCAPRKACQYYTQMAWAKTTNIGCAYA